MLGGWQDVIITTSSILPRPLLRALLSSGCKAVICRDAAAPQPPPEQAAGFFCALCQQLVAGRSLLSALERAGERRKCSWVSCGHVGVVGVLGGV